jgi:hypothetical protein
MDQTQTHAEIVPVTTYDPTTGVLGGSHDVDEIVMVRLFEDGVGIFANEQGLRALARQLLTLAQRGVPDGSELYLTSKGQAPTLADDSQPLRLIRLDSHP